MLAILPEVSSRALKAVRRQKFNHHRRGRPERLAAMVAKVAAGQDLDRFTPAMLAQFQTMAKELGPLMGPIESWNTAQLGHTGNPLQGRGGPDMALLPMAFIEGSPMHPAYGAGHATVAGACVTIIKAFFDMYTAPDSWTPRTLARAYVPDLVIDGGKLDLASSGLQLTPAAVWNGKLTIQGELDKLAANISIGRDMAGVHFYTDYYESLRLGERVAISILEEQMLTYPEPVKMRFETFDGDRMEISGSKAQAGASFAIKDCHGHPCSFREWSDRQLRLSSVA